MRQQPTVTFIASQHSAYATAAPIRRTVPAAQADRYEQMLRAFGWQHIAIVER